MMDLSTSKELEELQNRKAGLQDESRSLNDQQKNLDERVKVLEEKIAIEELKNSNKAARGAISQLESKMQELERRLREVSQEPEVHEPEKPPTLATETARTEEIAPVATELTSEDTEDEVVAVAAPEEPAMVEQETFTESKRTHDKKKRKFF
jgi:uncharacterized protein (DUF3084 family)